MTYNHKITDLIYQINNLVPKNTCDYFIKIFEDNKKHTTNEISYKYPVHKIEQDNFLSLDMSQLFSFGHEQFKEPLEIAKKFISIMITNYVLNINKNISPTFTNRYICNTMNIRILKYGVNHFIKDHCDIGGTENIRASCTLNLNEDYKGGEFRFFDGKIKRFFKTGDGMIFPAEPIWIHGTEPITKGTRYSINCFLF
jgi:hypothetical protein